MLNDNIRFSRGVNKLILNGINKLITINSTTDNLISAKEIKDGHITVMLETFDDSQNQSKIDLKARNKQWKASKQYHNKLNWCK